MKQHRRSYADTPFAVDTLVGVRLELAAHISDDGRPTYRVTRFRNGRWQPVGVIRHLAIDIVHRADDDDDDQFWYALLDGTKDILGPYPSMRPVIEALAVELCR